MCCHGPGSGCQERVFLRESSTWFLAPCPPLCVAGSVPWPGPGPPQRPSPPTRACASWPSLLSPHRLCPGRPTPLLSVLFLLSRQSWKVGPMLEPPSHSLLWLRLVALSSGGEGEPCSLLLPRDLGAAGSHLCLSDLWFEPGAVSVHGHPEVLLPSPGTWALATGGTWCSASWGPCIPRGRYFRPVCEHVLIYTLLLAVSLRLPWSSIPHFSQPCLLTA